MITRQDFMTGKATFEEYYGQFVDKALMSLVLTDFGKEYLGYKLRDDYYLNNIALAWWDTLAAVLYCDRQLEQKLRDAGDFMTKAGCVCILKQAARNGVNMDTININAENTDRNTVFPSAKALLEQGISCQAVGRKGWAFYWMEGGAEFTYFPGDEGPQEINDVDEAMECIGGDQPAVLTVASLKRFGIDPKKGK